MTTHRGLHYNKPLVSFLAILGIMTLIGFAGYYFGFLKFIYSVLMPGAFSGLPLPILAVVFGIAAFFSPCSFTVLPAYVAHSLGIDLHEQKRGRRIVRALSIGGIASLGILTINLIIGVAIALLGSSVPFAKDPRQDIPLILGIRVVTGFAITYFGLLTLLDRPFFIPILERGMQRLRSDIAKSTYLYGMFYNGAALGCTGPLLLGLMLYAFSTASFLGALSAFVIFASTMSVLMIVFTALIAISKESIIQSFSPALPVIKKIAGLVMIIAGLSIVALTLEGNRVFVRIFFPFLE